MEILKITGQNEDANGVWRRDDVERELTELGYTGMSWVEWVLFHAFDDIPEKTTDALVHLAETGDRFDFLAHVDGLRSRIEYFDS